MLMNPPVIALNMVSGLVSLMMLLAGIFAYRVLTHWDINSGSELQLRMERRTYLISTIMVFAFSAELIALLLFVYTAEQLSSQFVGAMCATGVLNVNPFGWPTLLLKIAIFFTGAVWLTLNRLDNSVPDYPLVRAKYRLLLLIIPLVILEMLVQMTFFLQLDPDVITSCCGSLFTPEGDGVAAEISAVEPVTALTALIITGVTLGLTGVGYLLRGKGVLMFALSAAMAYGMALVAIVSLIALYIYEHPHHHCPFCILKGGHDYIGYFLYTPLFLATALALAVGATKPYMSIISLTQVMPTMNRRYVLLSLTLFALFYLLSGYAIVSSNLTMLEVWW